MDFTAINQDNFLYVISGFLIITAIGLLTYLLKEQTKNNERLIKDNFNKLYKKVERQDHRLDNMESKTATILERISNLPCRNEHKSVNDKGCRNG